MKVPNRRAEWVVIGILILVVAGYLAYIVPKLPEKQELSSKEAMDIQQHHIALTARAVFGGGSRIPDGDLTALSIQSGVFLPKAAGLYDPPEERRVLAALSRLSIKNDRVFNEFGGDVRVLGHAGSVQVVYTQVPTTDCPAAAVCK